MAYGTNVGQDFSYSVDADAVTQYHFVTLGSDGNIDQAAGAAGESVIGVLQNDPTSGQSASVRTAGRTKVVAGATFAIGDLLCSDSSGRAIKYTKATVFTGTPYVVSGSMVLGIAEQAGSVGATVAMLYSPRGFSS